MPEKPRNTLINSLLDALLRAGHHRLVGYVVLMLVGANLVTVGYWLKSPQGEWLAWVGVAASLLSVILAGVSEALSMVRSSRSRTSSTLPAPGEGNPQATAGAPRQRK
jgi:hypothetical protein